MGRATDYFKGIISIFDKALSTAFYLISVFSVTYGVLLLSKVVSAKGNIPMTIDQTFLVFGAFFLVVGFVGSLIAYTILFFIRPSNAKENKKHTIDAIANRLDIIEKKIGIKSDESTKKP